MALSDCLRYWIELEPDGRYRFEFPDLPEASFSAPGLREGRERLLEEALRAVERRLKSRKTKFPEVPEFSTPRAGEGVLRLPPGVFAKMLLLQAASDRRITAGELARRMGIAPQEAARILRLSHPTKIDTVAFALAALGERLVVSTEPLKK